MTCDIIKKISLELHSALESEKLVKEKANEKIKEESACPTTDEKMKEVFSEKVVQMKQEEFQKEIIGDLEE